ncbi:hypothetical protein OsI_19722 [Oryza sativa Indica Group]|uniref:DUF7036 domain-containing protein n=1 Tax=Oryza sativa subsp. indica TaxID=39946 RepID=A2Y3Z3_ORYSI|nr:hypothetical protein OsI_19722 [Oryza sativa Indica Group]
MGKAVAGQRREQPEAAGGGRGGGGDGGGGGGCRGGAVRPQCVAALLLGAAMALSALFLLKPFAAHRARAGAPPPPGPPGDAFAALRVQDKLHHAKKSTLTLLTADIVASFMLQKTVSELSGSTSKLEFDIYGEIGIPNSTVAVNFLQPIGAPNWTNVIFSIVPYPKYSSISSMYLSILRASFMSLVVEQSTLHLTESLFGDTSLFEVLKFPGGITIIPPQAAFLLQKPYASFNFTLNFPIYKVQGRMNELKDQMKAGLQLDPYELSKKSIFLFHGDEELKD